MNYIITLIKDKDKENNVAKSKINTWLGHLWELNKGEEDTIINEIRSHLFKVRNDAKLNYELIKENKNEE